MIVDTVQFSDFWTWLNRSDNYSNNFSYEGARALFDYLEELSEEMEEPMDFDPVAWCIEFTEYATALEAAQDHGYEEVVDLEPHGSVDLIEVAELEEAQALEWLQDHTSVIEVDNGGVIVTEF